MTSTLARGHDGLERTRYYAGQLVGPDDLTEDQRYFRERLRRHNRLLHGWGVVCGARVRAGDDPCAVVVEPGYALAPQGDEILIDREVAVDLCEEDAGGDAVGCAAPDPWCGGVRVERPLGRPLYVAIRHAECDTRPVPTWGAGCDCEEAGCEYSRTRDSFAIRVLTELPESHRDGATAGLGQALSCPEGRPPACPACPQEPWVVLATVTLRGDAAPGIDCRTHRRQAATLAGVWGRCGAPGLKPPGLGGPRELVDRVSGGAAAPATVSMRRADGGWVRVPAHFSVTRGETLEELLSREGDRVLDDPATGESITLREAYALAGADPGRRVESVAEALAPLEGLRLRVDDLRVVRDGLSELLDDEGLERLDRDHLAAPGAAAELPAVRLRALDPESRLAARLGRATVGEVAAMERDEVVEAASRGLRGRARQDAVDRALAAWADARRTAGVARAWEEGAGAP
jgi:hypothetical protein